MEYKIEPYEKYILVSTSGIATVEKIDEALDAIFLHENWKPGFAYIFDHSLLLTENITFDDVKKIAEIARERRSKYNVLRSAIVATPDVQYGLSRMWSVYVGDEANVATNIFRNMEDAIAWVSA